MRLGAKDNLLQVGCATKTKGGREAEETGGCAALLPLHAFGSSHNLHVKGVPDYRKNSYTKSKCFGSDSRLTWGRVACGYLAKEWPRTP